MSCWPKKIMLVMVALNTMTVYGQTGLARDLQDALTMWPAFEREILEPLYPEGIGRGLGRYWEVAEPEARQEILRLYREYVSNPANAETLRQRARTVLASSAPVSPTLLAVPNVWALLGRDFFRNPHNTGEPNPNIRYLQRALNFYFLGRRSIAEDGYIRPEGETLEALRIFRQEHNLLPANKTILDEEVLLALSVYWLLSARPIEAPVPQPDATTEIPPPNTRLFPEMTANSIIEGLNRLAGRDLSGGNDLPDLAVMALQTALKTYLGPMRPFDITGRIGPSPSDPTLRALSRFQSDKGLPQSTVMSDRLIEELARVMLGFVP